MRSRAWALAFAAALSLAALPGAAGEPTLVDAPRVVPAFEVIEGYDWSVRTHATHLLLDATPLHSVLDASDAKPWIDLEITGLQPYQGYEITSGSEIRMVHADDRGAGIAWNVPNLPLSWVLSHSRSGFIIGSFTVEANPDFDPGNPFAPQASSCCCAQWQFWNCNRADPPKPTRTEPIMEAWATSHMLLPFAEGTKITLTGSSERAVKVGMKVSGGIAGGPTAGGEYSLKTKTTESFTALEPALFQTRVQLQKDVYEDQSYKIYAVSASEVNSWNPAGYILNPPEGAEIIEVNVRGENLEVGYDQEASGALMVGLQAFGETVSVTFEATRTIGSAVKITVPNPPVGSKWAFWYGYRPDSHSGMIAAVWQLE